MINGILDSLKESFFFFFLPVFQAGLSGSSAIVCAALSCLLDFYNVRHLIKVEIRPHLILSAEKELGIVAGLQDRVAQVYGGLVYMVSWMTISLYYISVNLSHPFFFFKANSKNMPVEISLKI